MTDLEGFTPEELEQLKNSPELRNLILGEEDDHGYPEPQIRDNLLKFFRDVLGLKSRDHEMISKTGNLKDGEIGWLSLPVRNYLSIANYCDTEGYGTVSSYLRGKAIITLNTSLSRKAKLLEFVVTQKNIKKNVLPKTVETKSGMFGSTTTESGGEED